MTTPTSLRCPRQLLTSFIVLAVVIGSSASAAPVPRPTVTGHTVIHATGAKGIRMSMPKDAQLPKANMKVDLEGGTFAFVGLMTSQCSILEGLREICMEFQQYLLPAAGGLTPMISMPDPPIVEAGPLDIYIVSDGEVTLTADFIGLDGNSNLEATGLVNGSVASLTTSCVSPLPCSNLGYGGLSKDVGDIGFAASVAYARRPQTIGSTPAPNPGSGAVEACVYPGSADPDGSPDPADHPDGCNFVPTPSQGDELNNVVTFGSGSAQVGVVGWARLAENLLGPSGDVYLGFTAQQVSPWQPGSFGASGVWLELGIECPSGDFKAC